MKTLNIILAIIFLLFAAVQFNDKQDDIMFWVLMYGGTGLISLFGAFRKYHVMTIVLGLAVVVFELFRKFPTFAKWIGDGMPSIVEDMQASTPHVELVREYLGLCICFAALIFQYIQFYKLRNKEESFIE
jgi:uncharacterized membrane protein